MSRDQLESVEHRTNNKDTMAWNHLSSTVRASIVKTVVRLCIMRAARNDTLLKSHLIAAVGEMNQTYRKLTGCAIKEAAVVLQETFGYLLITGDHFLISGGMEKARKEEYFLINELEYAILISLKSLLYLVLRDYMKFFRLCAVTPISPSLVSAMSFSCVSGHLLGREPPLKHCSARSEESMDAFQRPS